MIRRCGIVLALRLDGAKHWSLSMARSKAEVAAMAAEETEYLIHPDCLAVLAGGLLLQALPETGRRELEAISDDARGPH